MKDKNKPWQNESGCSDPTAHNALKPIMKEDAEIERKANDLIRTIKTVVALAGFDLVARIEIRHRRTRKEFR